MSTALGVGPISYQWRLNGVNIAGKTSQSLVIPVVKLSDNGNYDVVVSNPAGSVTSPASVVNVDRPPTIAIGVHIDNDAGLSGVDRPTVTTGL